MKHKSPQKHRRAKRIAKRDQWGMLTIGNLAGDGLLFYDATATTWTLGNFDTAGFTTGDTITISGTTQAVKKINKKVHVARRRKARQKAASSDGVYTIKEINGSTITVDAGDTITLNYLYSEWKDWLCAV